MFRVRNRVRVRIMRIGFRRNGIRRNGAEPSKQTYRRNVKCEMLIDFTEFIHKQSYSAIHRHAAIILIGFFNNIEIQVAHLTAFVF